MYTLSRILSPRQLLTEQVPMIFASLLIAELFYKFHSFTLEAIAFLGTWYLFDVVAGWLGVNSGSRNAARKSRK